MKPPISNITQANEEMAHAMAHFSRVQVFLDKFQDVLGKLSAPSEGHMVARTGSNGRNPEGRTMADRVLILMREIGGPVWPRAVATEYERRRWPMPRAGTIYEAVNSAMNYLLHRRRVLQRNAQGYFLPDQILSDSVGGKKAGRATRA